jgi:drug/metabolite transporter (DMT)-like permease
MHHLIFAIICLLWGSNFLLMKKALGSFGPITVGAGRVALGAAVVAVILLLRREAWPVRMRHVGHLCIVTVFSYVYPYTVQPYLINQSGSSAFVGMMVSLVPLCTILVSMPLLRIGPTPTQVAGVLGGLVCFCLVFYEGATVRHLTALDLALAAGVPIGYAAVNTYIKRFLHDLPAVPLTLASLGMAAMVLVPLGLAVEPVRENAELPVSLAALLVIGPVGTGLATILFYKLIRDHGPLFAGMVTYIIPIVALLLGAADREQLTLMQVAALVGIFAMVALVQHRPRQGPPGREDVSCAEE